MGAVRDFDLPYTVLPASTSGASDDISSDQINLPFTFLGTYPTAWVRVNGSIGFYGASSAPYPDPDHDPPEDFILGQSIFPYWANIDRRDDPLGLAKVRYAVGPGVVVAEWISVGREEMDYTGRATFQVVLRANYFEINYDEVGFDDPAFPALAGWHLTEAGEGTTFLLGCEAANLSSTFDTLTDGGSNPLIDGSLNSAVLGRYVHPVAYDRSDLSGAAGGRRARFWRA